MHPVVRDKSAELAALCRRFGVSRLDVFGSAARASDFDAARSDIDLLVEFDRADLTRFLDFRDALQALLTRPVDLVDRQAIMQSRNYIRRRRILAGAETVYAA
jgi:predicted nucleotidyltransferase